MALERDAENEIKGGSPYPGEIEGAVVQQVTWAMFVRVKRLHKDLLEPLVKMPAWSDRLSAWQFEGFEDSPSKLQQIMQRVTLENGPNTFWAVQMPPEDQSLSPEVKWSLSLDELDTVLALRSGRAAVVPAKPQRECICHNEPGERRTSSARNPDCPQHGDR